MSSPPRGTWPSVLRGIGLIARGRPVGLNCFRDTPRAVLYSLTPGAGILAAGVVEGFASGDEANALAQIPGSICILLAPAVLSFEVARIWGREAFWMRYIVAFNWCQWLISAVGIVLVTVLTAARAAGIQGPANLKTLLILLGFYAMWLNWFIARHGLALSPWRAAGLVAMVNLGTAIIVFGPMILASSNP